MDNFKITERITPNKLEFSFSSVAEIATNLKIAISRGVFSSKKRYQLIIKEI